MAPSPVSCRTTDSRGYASTVSFSQWWRSGNLDRRLYGGLCAAISRSSRISASSPCAHSIASTRCAAASISEIRARFSAAVKYDLTRVAIAPLLPTYSGRSSAARNTYTPGASGSPSARCRLRRCSGLTALANSIASPSVKILKLPSRPNSACSTSTVARASCSARCVGVRVWKCPASVASRRSGTSSRVSARRASAAVSSTRGAGHGYPYRPHAARRNPMSYGAL